MRILPIPCAFHGSSIFSLKNIPRKGRNHTRKICQQLILTTRILQVLPGLCRKCAPTRSCPERWCHDDTRHPISSAATYRALRDGVLDAVLRQHLFCDGSQHCRRHTHLVAEPLQAGATATLTSLLSRPRCSSHACRRTICCCQRYGVPKHVLVQRAFLRTHLLLLRDLSINQPLLLMKVITN